MKATQVRMTEGSIPDKIVRFAVPLFLGNLFQQLYNTADALIVGNLLGDRSLAAVTSTGTLVFLLVGFFAGIFMGAGVVISRYFGSRETEKMRKAVHNAILFALLSGTALTLIGTTLTPIILGWMGTPAEVMPQSVTYIRIYFAGSLGLSLYNACMGIMQAVGDSRHPLYYLIISSVTNVCLDLLFIGVFRMGVDGAALATILAQFLSAALCLRRLFRTKEDHRLVLREIRPDREMLRLILRYGLPSGFQNSVIGFANVVVQSNINAFGELAMSGCGAYAKVEGFAFLPITSFTSAITTSWGRIWARRSLTGRKRAPASASSAPSSSRRASASSPTSSHRSSSGPSATLRRPSPSAWTRPISAPSSSACWRPPTASPPCCGARAGPWCPWW